MSQPLLSPSLIERTLKQLPEAINNFLARIPKTKQTNATEKLKPIFPEIFPSNSGTSNRLAHLFDGVLQYTPPTYKYDVDFEVDVDTDYFGDVMKIKYIYESFPDDIPSMLGSKWYDTNKVSKWYDTNKEPTIKPPAYVMFAQAKSLIEQNQLATITEADSESEVRGKINTWFINNWTTGEFKKKDEEFLRRVVIANNIIANMKNSRRMVGSEYGDLAYFLSVSLYTIPVPNSANDKPFNKLATIMQHYFSDWHHLTCDKAPYCIDDATTVAYFTTEILNNKIDANDFNTILNKILTKCKDFYPSITLQELNEEILKEIDDTDLNKEIIITKIRESFVSLYVNKKGIVDDVQVEYQANNTLTRSFALLWLKDEYEEDGLPDITTECSLQNSSTHIVRLAARVKIRQLKQEINEIFERLWLQLKTYNSIPLDMKENTDGDIMSKFKTASQKQAEYFNDQLKLELHTDNNMYNRIDWLEQLKDGRDPVIEHNDEYFDLIFNVSVPSNNISTKECYAKFYQYLTSNGLNISAGMGAGGGHISQEVFDMQTQQIQELQRKLTTKLIENTEQANTIAEKTQELQNHTRAIEAFTEPTQLQEQIKDLLIQNNSLGTAHAEEKTRNQQEIITLKRQVEITTDARRLTDESKSILQANIANINQKIRDMESFNSDYQTTTNNRLVVEQERVSNIQMEKNTLQRMYDNLVNISRSRSDNDVLNQAVTDKTSTIQGIQNQLNLKQSELTGAMDNLQRAQETHRDLNARKNTIDATMATLRVKCDSTDNLNTVQQQTIQTLTDKITQLHSETPIQTSHQLIDAFKRKMSVDMNQVTTQLWPTITNEMNRCFNLNNPDKQQMQICLQHIVEYASGSRAAIANNPRLSQSSPAVNMIKLAQPTTEQIEKLQEDINRCGTTTCSETDLLEIQTKILSMMWNSVSSIDAKTAKNAEQIASSVLPRVDARLKNLEGFMRMTNTFSSPLLQSINQSTNTHFVNNIIRNMRTNKKIHMNKEKYDDIMYNTIGDLPMEVITENDSYDDLDTQIAENIASCKTIQAWISDEPDTNTETVIRKEGAFTLVSRVINCDPRYARQYLAIGRGDYRTKVPLPGIEIK